MQKSIMSGNKLFIFFFFRFIHSAVISYFVISDSSRVAIVCREKIYYKHDYCLCFVFRLYADLTRLICIVAIRNSMTMSNGNFFLKISSSQKKIIKPLPSADIFLSIVSHNFICSLCMDMWVRDQKLNYIPIAYRKVSNGHKKKTWDNSLVLLYRLAFFMYSGTKMSAYQWETIKMFAIERWKLCACLVVIKSWGLLPKKKIYNNNKLDFI